MPCYHNIIKDLPSKNQREAAFCREPAVLTRDRIGAFYVIYTIIKTGIMTTTATTAITTCADKRKNSAHSTPVLLRLHHITIITITIIIP